jgi:hypothetical protein
MSLGFMWLSFFLPIHFSSLSELQNLIYCMLHIWNVNAIVQFMLKLATTLKFMMTPKPHATFAVFDCGENHLLH